jgi:vacuolar-type H+-ATPase subunit H
MVYKTTIKKMYGLTESMIDELGPPDKIVPNPHYTSREAYLYLIERVETWLENNRERVEKARKRRERLSKALTERARKRAEDLVEWSRNAAIELDAVNRDTIQEEAQTHYTLFFALERGKEAFPVGVNGVVSYVRHNYTNYEDLLYKIKGKPGCWAAYEIIKDRVNKKITENLALQPSSRDAENPVAAK